MVGGGGERGMRKIHSEELRNFLIFIRFLFAWSDRPEWNCGPYSTSVKEEKHGDTHILVRNSEAKKKNFLKDLNVDGGVNNITSGSEDWKLGLSGTR